MGGQRVAELGYPSITPLPQLLPGGTGVRQSRREGLLPTDRGGLQGSEVFGSPETLGPLVQFAAGAGQLGLDPSAPVAAPPELGGVLPPLEYRPFAVGGRVGPGQEEGKVPGLMRVPSGSQEGKTVVAQDAEAKTLRWRAAP